MSRRVKLALNLSPMHRDNHNPDGGAVGFPHIVNPGLHRNTGRHKQVPTVSAEVPMRYGSSDGLCASRVIFDDAKSAGGKKSAEANNLKKAQRAWRDLRPCCADSTRESYTTGCVKTPSACLERWKICKKGTRAAGCEKHRTETDLSEPSEPQYTRSIISAVWCIYWQTE